MIIKIYANGSYHLFNRLKDPQAISMTEILKDCKGKYSKAYGLYRKFDADWEKVGTIRVRDLLLLPYGENPIYNSLRRLRGEGYTWSDFVASRKKKLKEKKGGGEKKNNKRNG